MSNEVAVYGQGAARLAKEQREKGRIYHGGHGEHRVREKSKKEINELRELNE